MKNISPGRPRSAVDEHLLRNASQLFQHFGERVGLVQLAVDNVLERYFAHCERLVDEFRERIREKYWHAGLYFRVQRRKIHKTDFHIYDIKWAQGRVVNNDPGIRSSNIDLDARFTDAIHRCDNESGEYTINNFRSVCFGKAEFEVRLALEYEKVLRPLRADLQTLSSLTRAIIHYGSLPDMDVSLDAIPYIGIEASVDSWKMIKQKRNRK